VSDESPTPKKLTGSYMRAVGFRAVCENVAMKAAERARELGPTLGRRDIAFDVLSIRASELAANFHRWTLPHPRGRVDMTERGADMAAYEELLRDSRSLGIEPLG